MICKNCGAQLSENSVFCGNCGSPVAQEQPIGFGGNMPNPNPQVGDNGFQPAPNQNYNPNQNPNPNPISGGVSVQGAAPKKKPSWFYIVISAAALLVVVGIVFGVIQVAGSDPDKTIDRFMIAFQDCDGEAMNAEVSKSFKKAYLYGFETVDLANDGKLRKKVGMELDEYVEEYFEEECEDFSNDFFSYFEYNLNNNYKTDYEITKEKFAEKDELKKFNEIVSRLSGSDNFNAKGLMLADIKVTGKSGSKKYEKELTLFLCKDGSKWQVLQITDIGFDFDDLYSLVGLDQIESYLH